MKSIIKRAIAVLLIFTVVLLASCSMDLSPVKAAEIGGNADLDGYGAYISNDELGEIVSYGGYISKTEYASMLNDNSVGASYNPSFAGCYDTNGYQIYVRRAMAGQYVGEAALLISVNGSRAYCIEPGEALNAYSNLTETTSSGVWASLSGNQQQAINTALCYGREGNFSNIKGSSSINSDQCYIATQLIIWEIVNGERSAAAPFSLNGNGYLSMYCADGYNGNIANAYHKIENAMAAAQTVPSFATKTASDAPLYTLNATYNNVKRTWSYTPLTLTDSNSVMAQFAGFNNKTIDVGNATVTVSVSENKITLTPSAGKLNASGRTVSFSATKTGIPSSNEAKLIAYASSYQDVVSGGSASAPTAYFSVNVNIKQNAKLDYDFHVRKVIGTQNEYDTCQEDVIEGVASTAENLKGWYFRVEVSNVSTFYRYYNVKSFVLGPTDEAGRTQTVAEYVMEHFDYSNVSTLVPTGYYEVTEIGRKVGSSYIMPDFYAPDRTTHSFLFDPGSNSQDKPVISECYYTNIFSITLEIIKTTDDGSTPENYYFTVTNQETGTTYTAHVNRNGTFCPLNQTRAADGRTYLTLPEGRYTLTELGLKQSGVGYAIPYRFAEPLPVEFEITPDAYKQALESGYQAVTVKVDNKCEGKIKLRKTEEGNEQSVAGATYGLFSDDQCLNLIYQFPQTDSKGETVTEDKYPCGEQYYVKEIEAPQGYALSDTVYPVIIDPKNEVEIVYELPVTDEKANNPVEIRKTDITGTKELAGAVLEVRAYNGALISSWVSNGSAHVIADVQPGTYTLTEKSPANGYVTAESIQFTVKGDGTTTKVAMKDAPTRIQINKVDEKGNALKGVQLQVLDNTGKVVIPTWTTNGSPYEITGKLIVGAKYKLHEVSTLLEYNISRDVSFTVKDTPDVQTVKMINRKKTGQIVINKFDGSGQPIVGAQWKVYRKDNSELKFYRVSEGYFTYSESGTVTTLSTANISLTAVNMPLGEYYLVEEIPPSGKMSYGRKIPFTIAPDNTETLNLTINVKDNNIIIPNTGSNGRDLYNAVGLFLFTAALAVFIYHKKNKIYQSRTR